MESQKLENLCYTRLYAHYPRLRYWNLSLLPSCLVVQETGCDIREPSRTRGWDRTSRQTWAAGSGIRHYANGWFDPVDGRVGHARGLLHRTNIVGRESPRPGRQDAAPTEK